MAASIVKRFDTLLGPYDDDRLIEDLIFGPIPDIGDLLESAGHLPDMWPEVLALELVELLIEIASRADTFRDP